MEGAGGGGGGFLSLNSSALTSGMMAVLLNSAPRDAWVCECPSFVTLAHVDLTVVLTKDRFEIFSSPTSSWLSAEVLSSYCRRILHKMPFPLPVTSLSA